MNTADPEPFYRATQDILGKDNVYPMIAFGTMQEKDAFKSYCRGKEIPKSEYWDVTDDLERYRHTDKWRDIIAESQRFIGVVNSYSPSPCAYLLLSEPISEKVGLIHHSEGALALIDSGNSDTYKYLKND